MLNITKFFKNDRTSNVIMGVILVTIRRKGEDSVM